MSNASIPLPNLATLKSWVRQLSSIAGLFVGISNDLHLPSNVRVALLAVSGWVQVTQHNIDATNDPTVPTVPVPTTAPTPPVTP